ncbi:MAG: hypothetical protein H6622_09790 [Halobacteriovoraceae bacterium]|nr:hypothetical protein [Halobacteriovoraceae bacterium]
MALIITRRNCREFNNHFKFYMNEMSLPVPQNGFETAEKAIGTIVALTYNLEKYPQITIREIAASIPFAAAPASGIIELSVVAAGILASTYAGAAIGATMRSLIDMGACNYATPNIWRFYTDVTEFVGRPHWLNVEIVKNPKIVSINCENTFLKKEVHK